MRYSETNIDIIAYKYDDFKIPIANRAIIHGVDIKQEFGLHTNAAA